MPQYITDNEATAARRRTFFLIADEAGAAWTGAVLGVKARRSVNGGAEVDSTNDIVRVGGLWHYVEWTQAEVNVTPGDRILSRVPAATGRREAPAMNEIGADDIFAAGPTAASVSTEVLGDLAGVDGVAARAAIGEQAALTIVGAGDLRFDDTTGSSLVVLRKSTSAAVATVPLRRATRTQPVVGNG
jgi:hypothetical protein